MREIFAFLSLIVLLGCKDKECTVNYKSRADGDTIFFGHWEYVYTISRTTLYIQEPPIVADDTVFYDETRTWMPSGHPKSFVFIHPSDVTLMNFWEATGQTCQFDWYADSFPLEISIKLSNDEDFSGCRDIFQLLAFRQVTPNLIRCWQDPYYDCVFVDMGLPNTDTYDYYRRVP